MGPASQNFISSVCSACNTHGNWTRIPSFLFSQAKQNFSVLVLPLFPVSRLASGGIDYQRGLEGGGQPVALPGLQQHKAAAKFPLLANPQLARPSQRMNCAPTGGVERMDRRCAERILSAASTQHIFYVKLGRGCMCFTKSPYLFYTVQKKPRSE